MKNTPDMKKGFAMRRDRMLALAFLGTGMALLAGCSGGGAGNDSTGTTGPQGAALKGTVMGGQQPVVGSTVTIFAVGTTGNGSAATSLGSATTDAKGNWSISVACGSAADQVYVVATGGNAGFAGANAQLGMMAALGNCGPAATATTVNINEVTTIAASYALAQFISISGSSPNEVVNIGASSTNATGIANAMAIATTNLADFNTGKVPASLPAGVTAPSATLYSLANLIAACVNSTGGTAGDATACGTLFTDATPSGGTAPTNTLQAALDIALNPSNNVAALFNDVPASPVFAGGLGSAPNDWSLALQYQPTDLQATAASAGSQPASYGLAIDGSGNAWVTMFDGAKVVKVGPTGTAVSPSGGYTATGAVTQTWDLAIDPAGNVWVTNYTSPAGTNSGLGSVVKLSGADGSDLSSGGFAGGGVINHASAVAFDGTSASFKAYVTDLDSTSDANRGLLVQVDPATGALVNSTDVNLNKAKALAIDGNQNIWVADELTTTGNVKGAMTEVPEASFTPGPQITTGGVFAPYQVAIDQGNNVWLANDGANSTGTGNSVSKFNNSGTAISPTAGFSTGGSKVNSPWGLAIDGANNVWVAVQSNVSSPAGFTGGVLEMTSAGTLVGPSGFVGLTGGLKGATGPVSQPSSIAIDASGNVWVGTNSSKVVFNAGTSSSAGSISGGISTGLTVVIGAAAPVKTPMIGVPAAP